MKPQWRVLFCAVVGLIALGKAVGANAPVAGSDSFPGYPWFKSHTLPTESERKALQSAREAAEKDPEVADRTKRYINDWVVADDFIRIKMLENPASKPFLKEIVLSEQIHERTWYADYDDNDPDILLPDGVWTAMANAGEFVVFKFSSKVFSKSPGPKTYPPDSLGGIRQAVLADAQNQKMVQLVRVSYQKLDAVVRTAMQQNAEIKALMEKYDFLLYGRKDLGFIETTAFEG